MNWPAFLASLYFFPPSFPILEQFFVIYWKAGGPGSDMYKGPLSGISRIVTHSRGIPCLLIRNVSSYLLFSISSSRFLSTWTKFRQPLNIVFVNWYIAPRTLITTSGFDTFFWAFHSEVNFKLLKISLKDFFFSCETTNYLNRNPHHQALPMKLPTDGGARFAARFLRISYGISGHFWSGCSVHI